MYVCACVCECACRLIELQVVLCYRQDFTDFDETWYEHCATGSYVWLALADSMAILLDVRVREV